MFYAPPPPEYRNVAPFHEGVSVHREKGEPQKDSVPLSEMGGVPRTNVKLGRAVYPFRTQLLERISPSFYSLEGFYPHIVGTGADHEAARSDFDRRLQTVFEEIRGLEDFDRTDEQQHLWELISSLIDIPAHERQRTMTVKQMGKVIGVPKAGKVRVRWAQGRTYCVDISKADAEFSAFRVGQWFEAVVRRNYLDGKFLKIEHVARIKTPEYSEAERRAFWKKSEPSAAGE